MTWGITAHRMGRPVRSLPLPMPKSSSTPVLSLPVEVGLMVPGDYGWLWFVVMACYGQVKKPKKKDVKKELRTTQDEAGNVPIHWFMGDTHGIYGNWFIGILALKLFNSYCDFSWVLSGSGQIHLTQLGMVIWLSGNTTLPTRAGGGVARCRLTLQHLYDWSRVFFWSDPYNENSQKVLTCEGRLQIWWEASKNRVILCNTIHKHLMQALVLCRGTMR